MQRKVNPPGTGGRPGLNIHTPGSCTPLMKSANVRYPSPSEIGTFAPMNSKLPDFTGLDFPSTARIVSIVSATEHGGTVTLTDQKSSACGTGMD